MARLACFTGPAFAVGCSMLLTACPAATPSSVGSFQGVIAGYGETGIMNLSIDETPDPETGYLPAYGHMETTAANPYVSTLSGSLEESYASLSAHADNGGYIFEGAPSGDLLLGTYRRSNPVDGAFAMINTSHGAITRLCGSLSGAKGGTIALAIAASGTAVACVYVAPGNASVLQGSSNEATIGLDGTAGRITGSIQSDKATGTWVFGAETGTWTATACLP